MANKVRTIFANMSWMLIAQIVSSVLAFIWTILLARYLGPSEYGIFGTAVSFSGLFAILIDCGISGYIVRAISTDFDKESIYLNNAMTISLFLSIVYFFVIFLALVLLGWDNYIVLICLLYAIETIIIKLANLFTVPFQAHEEFKYGSIGNMITSISTFIILMYIVFFTSFGLTGVSITFIFANLLTFSYYFHVVRKNFVKPKFLFNLNLFKKLIIGGFPFAIVSVFNTIYFSIDVVMITQFVGTYETGLYNAAYKLINVLSLFYTIYSGVIYPVMTKLFKNSKELLHVSFIKSIKYLLLASVPIAVFTCCYSSDIINIYGSQYAEASGVIYILIWAVCFLFVNGACSMTLYASYKDYAVTKIFGIAAVFNVVMNLVLIPYYSVYGAAFATVLSEVVILSLELYSIKQINQLPDKNLVFDVLKIGLSSFILAIVLYYLNINLWLAMPVSIVIYFGLIFLFKILDESDIEIIKQVLDR